MYSLEVQELTGLEIALALRSEMTGCAHITAVVGM